jgi:hypothetical protein
MGIMWGMADRERPPSRKPLPGRKPSPPREPLSPVDVSKVAPGYWVVALASILSVPTSLVFISPLFDCPPAAELRWFAPVLLTSLAVFSVGLVLHILRSPVKLHRVLSIATLSLVIADAVVLLVDSLGRLSAHPATGLQYTIGLTYGVTLTFAVGSVCFCRKAGFGVSIFWAIIAACIALIPLVSVTLGCLAIVIIALAPCLLAAAGIVTAVAARRSGLGFPRKDPS